MNKSDVYGFIEDLYDCDDDEAARSDAVLRCIFEMMADNATFESEFLRALFRRVADLQAEVEDLRHRIGSVQELEDTITALTQELNSAIGAIDDEEKFNG